MAERSKDTRAEIIQITQCQLWKGLQSWKMRMVSMIISGICCSDYERKALVAMMHGKGKKKQDDKEDFGKVLDREMERRSNGEQNNTDR